MAFVLLPASALLIALLMVPTIFGDFMAYQIGLFLIYGIAAQGIGFLWGKTGVLPLGQALFFGAGAYASAHILRDVNGLGLQLPLLVLVVVTIGLLSFALATVIFRGRDDSGPYFSLITLALVMIAEQVASTATDVTGGFNGFSGFGTLGGLDVYKDYYYVVVGVLTMTTVGLLALNQLPASLVASAVQDNEPRLQLLGFRTHVVKGICFAFSAMIAGLAGVLFASHQGIVTPTSTGFALSAELVILTAVGGRFHVFGPIIGAVLIGLLSAQLRNSFPYWELLLAGVFIVVVLRAPGGLAELIAGAFRRFIPIQKLSPSAQAIPAPATKLPTISRPLSFEDVHVRLEPVRILNGVSFETPTTGIVSIIGPNGAGKTSVLNTITGNLSVRTGRIRLGDEIVANRSPQRALASGIGRKLQVPSVFSSMSVRENLVIATMAGRAKWSDYFRPATLRWQSPNVLQVFSDPRVQLEGAMDNTAGTLSQGHKQFLEFAMTVAASPALLLLDEPCAGLSHAETELMTDLVRAYQVHSGGLTIIIEHDMSIVEAISDKVIVLHQGQVLAYDSYAAIKQNAAVQAVYAGDTK